ncbi:MAG TPA: type II toxin-antitoxin system PemK/MazF family toxin [bacterium]|nr:type II toxin-antitoxin system PemK/MazF family toxin [bacterium]
MSNASIEPQRGEVWLVRFDPAIGSEFQKTRPAVVVNEDQIGRLNMRIVVPITNWKEEFSGFLWVVGIKPTALNGLSKISGADSSQVKSVSIKRFEKKLGTLSTADLKEIITGVVLCIGYDCPICENNMGNG